MKLKLVFLNSNGFLKAIIKTEVIECFLHASGRYVNAITECELHYNFPIHPYNKCKEVSQRINVLLYKTKSTQSFALKKIMFSVSLSFYTAQLVVLYISAVF